MSAKRPIRRLLSGLFACALGVSLLAGCGTTPEPTAPASPGGTQNASQSGQSPLRVLSVTPKALQSTQDLADWAVRSAAKGANDFAFRLGAALLAENADDNFVCSPVSVWLPLAALVNATDDAHRDELLSALGAQGVSGADLNTAASRMLYNLTRQDERDFWEGVVARSGGSADTLTGKEREELERLGYDPLQIANAVFVDSGVTLRQDFAQTFADDYRGSVMNVDFKSQQAVDAVNQWASDNTGGLIDDIVQSFDPKTVAAIANAIYFSDGWNAEFDPAATQAGTFHGAGGDGAANFMLRQGDGLTYYEDDALQAMPLYFLHGGAMWVLLPKNGDARGLLSSMTTDYFAAIQSSAAGATGKLLLPRFSLENGLELSDALKALGVPLFDKKSAPLTGGLLQENIHVWLSSATQQALIKVDEKGTTAAAVTVMAADGASLPVHTAPFEMICDHPFAFILCADTADGGSQVLFTGVVGAIDD